MESAEELQQQEITALKSIYAEDFFDSPPPKAWKGAARLHEFSIRVLHIDPRYAYRISFNLNVKFPKTYPSKTHPIFAIQQPIKGMTPNQVTKLSTALHGEAQNHQGTEMVFQIVSFCQEWIEKYIPLPLDTPGSSLASEMNKRALEEQKLRQQRASAEAEEENERAAQAAAQLTQQIMEDTMKKEELQRIEKERYRARRRAVSDATERPLASDVMTQSFDHVVEVHGIRFEAVKLFHARKECLGTTYSAEPVCDDLDAALPMELHVVIFDSHYYTTNQGKKKLRQVETEIQRLMSIRHENLLRIYAVTLTTPKLNGPSRLHILMEQRPALSLQDVLQSCEFLREERVSDYLGQILAALHAVHAADIVHRGINAACVGLAHRQDGGHAKLVKLSKVAYYTKLQDLHKSDPFGPKRQIDQHDSSLPDGWLPRDAVDSPLLYTRSRDLHAVGIILLQMLMGLDVTEQYPDARTALRACSLSQPMQRQVMDMLTASKKNPTSCLTLLGKLAQTAFHTTPRSQAIAIDVADNKTPVPRSLASSPDDYFRPAPTPARKASRWREDWEELELLGRGGFGSVVKARNTTDNRIYAVKKIKLRATQNDNKIFREVHTLSRLSHRFVVRYYTAWLETSEPTSSNASSDSDEEGKTWKPLSSRSHDDSTDPFSIDLDDLGSGSASTSSFPSIHFSGNDMSGDDDDSDDGISNLFEMERSGWEGRTVTPPPPTLRTLYIQMEFVERQTLKERIAEGLAEDEAWRLFQQILDALVHMSTLGILHRDIKLTNIFIGMVLISRISSLLMKSLDGKGDCKVGDFGLATSSLAAVDPSDVSPHAAVTESTDMTLEVGTRLYIAPEVLTPRGGPRNHSKADLYSLGIVFFEMNFQFETGSERIAVIESLRRPDICFPDSWEAKRAQQKSIITWLLQHNPSDRPTALELSQSPLLPSRVEDEYFKGALRMMAKPDSPHYQSVLSSLFSQPPRPVHGFLYDHEMPEHASLNGIVKDRLIEVFRLHGAVDMEPPLLMPNMGIFAEDPRQAFLLDRHGDVVCLPTNALVPFARLAARTNVTRIKRFHIGDSYRHYSIAGHPKVSKAAVFDIVTPDVATGLEVATAELIGIMNECLSAFPNLGHNYEIHVSHSSISDVALGRVPENLRTNVTDILSQTKSSSSQKRALLIKKGLLRSTVDELEALSDTYDDMDLLQSRVDKASSQLLALTRSAFQDMKKTVEFAALIGGGVSFEVVRRNKKTDILAAGGRYDHLISQFSPPNSAKSDSICAVGLQIALERITASLAAFQSVSVTNLIKEQRSFGFWSARRCDVYIVSFQPGHLQERLEVAAMLWQHNISADVMYETGVADADLESLAELCGREGILFTVYPRSRGARRELSAYKVKSVLRGTEYEISRQELVGWLQQQIAEQKRVDLGTSGLTTVPDSVQGTTLPKENSSSFDMQLLLPGDTKKQRKQTKQLLYDKAYDMGLRVKSAVQSGVVPMLALDVPPAVFDAMAKGDQWVTDDDAWRPIATGFPPQHAAYAALVREAASRRKSDGFEFVQLFAVREERVALLCFS